MFPHLAYQWHSSSWWNRWS